MRRPSTRTQSSISIIVAIWNSCCIQKSAGSHPRSSPAMLKAPTV